MIDIFIINRDLVTWPQNMVKKIKIFKGINRIFIVDNQSTYPRCHDWYNEDKDVNVIKLDKNYGHGVVWELKLPEKYNSSNYIVTDPDLDISALPDDTCLHLKSCYDKRLYINKIGLSLEISDIPEDSIHFPSLWEKHLWKVKSDDEVFNAPVDTTFAYYDAFRNSTYKIGGGRTKPPYTAKHIPWYYTESMLFKDEEFLYYLKNASTSSTIKVHSVKVRNILKLWENK
jgi:hypothetical protein